MSNLFMDKTYKNGGFSLGYDKGDNKYLFKDGVIYRNGKPTNE